MLYQLFTWLNQEFNVPGAGMFEFLTFRIAMAVLLSLIIATVFGKKIIEFLQKKQIGETVRELGLQGEQQKKRYTNHGRYHYFVKHFNSNLIICQSRQGIYPFNDFMYGMARYHWIFR